MSTDELRPLWQLLLETTAIHRKRPLTCVECLDILEFLAEIIPRDEAGYHAEALRQAIAHHLSYCPDCRDYYLERLRTLEALLTNNDGTSA